jgi:hypothetical protein
MRKLTKTRQIPGFDEWYNQNPSKKYNSPNGDFYYSIVRNLFSIRDGLCAYTERRLCPKKHYVGLTEFSGNEKSGFDGNLEHFDASLKGSNGWQWDNFLMAHTDTNRRKNNKPVNYILKPDSADYDPNFYLSYNYEKHLFHANTENLTSEEIIRVNGMIVLLGISFDSVVDDREKYFEEMISQVEFKLADWQDFEGKVDRFYTAFKMIKTNFSST